MIRREVVRIRSVLLIFISIWLTCSHSIQAFNVKAKAPGNMKVPDFELKDQYDKAASYRFPKQKITVLTFGDRKGSEQIEGWVRPLWDRYQTKIDQQGVAVLTSVPFFARGVVRGIFKSKVKYSVLLDWTGDVSKSFGYQSGRANVYVINRDGQIVLTVTGTASQTELDKVFAQIDRIL